MRIKSTTGIGKKFISIVLTVAMLGSSPGNYISGGELPVTDPGAAVVSQEAAAASPEVSAASIPEAASAASAPVDDAAEAPAETSAVDADESVDFSALDDEFAVDDDPVVFSDGEETGLVERTLTVQLNPQQLYVQPNVPADGLAAVNQLWQRMFGRDPKPADDQNPGVVNVEITGEMPEDVTAQAGVILFDEGEDCSETAIASIDVSFNHADGTEYLPDSELDVTVSGTAIQTVMEAGKPYFLIYAHNEYSAGEALIVDETEFSSDVTVYRKLPKDSSEAQEEKWVKRNSRIRYVVGNELDTVTFYEDPNGLKQNKEQNSISFTTTSIPLNFIVSAQRPGSDDLPLDDVIVSEDTADAASEDEMPQVILPETAAPEVVQPETAAPEVVQPETAAPEVVQPETAAPEVVQPETAAPEEAQSETIISEESQPDVSVIEDMASDISDDVPVVENSEPEAIVTDTPAAEVPATETPAVEMPVTEEIPLTEETLSSEEPPVSEVSLIEDDAAEADTAAPETIQTEAAQPVTETAEPATESVQFVTETALPATESVQPVTEAAQPAADIIEPATEAAQLVTETVQPVMEETQLATEASQPETETAQTEETAPVIEIIPTEETPSASEDIQTENAEETELAVATESVAETESAVVSESETETETESATETEIETETLSETEIESESEIKTETEMVSESETETQAETDTEAETEVETELSSETETESEASEELTNRLLRTTTEDGITKVSVTGLMPKGVSAEAWTEDAQAYSSDIDAEGLLAVDISLSREVSADGDADVDKYQTETDPETDHSDENTDRTAAEDAKRDAAENASANAEALSNVSGVSSDNETTIDENYQPVLPVRVTITDPLIGEARENDCELEVWHVSDDGTKTKVEDVRFVRNSAVFYAEGFSVYVVVCTTLEQTLTASDGNEYSVIVTYDNTSGIPGDAELYVSEIKEGEAGYDEYVAQSASALGQNPENLAFARPFDITLKNPQTGEEYQPNESVQVSIQLLKDDLNNYSNVDVVHIPDGAGENAQVMDTTVHGEAVEFAADGFSVYVLCGFTVDFHWGEYTYNLQGGNEILLSDLLRILAENVQDAQENGDSHGEDNTYNTPNGSDEVYATTKLRELAEDLGDVEDVVFSDPELLEVVKTDEGDWVLKSLRVFDSEELLTIKLVGGEEIKIWVTDATIVDSGTCGTDTVWSLDSEGVLTISLAEGASTGTVTSFVKNWQWNNSDNINLIKKAIIDEGIVSLPSTGANQWSDGLFVGCSNIEEVQFPSTLTSIPKCTCQNLTKLKTVNFSELTSLQSIGGNAFLGCTVLESAVRITSGNAFSSLGDAAFQKCNAISEVDLTGTTINAIGNRTFWQCTALTTVHLPTTVTAINSAEAFSGCTNLTSVNLSELTSLVTIGTQAFNNCKNLTGINFENLASLQTIGNDAFQGCTALNCSILSSELQSLKSVGIAAFKKSGITEVDLSGLEMTAINNNAFSYCENLTKVVLPSGITKIDYSAIQGNKKLTTLDLSACKSIQTIGNYAFADARMQELDLSNNVELTSVGSEICTNCINLTKVDMSGCAALTSIGGGAFKGCSNVTDVDLSDCTSLTSIGDNIFNNCTKIATLDLSDTGLSDLSAFSACMGTLKELRLSGCSNMKTVDVSGYTALETLYLSPDVTSLTLNSAIKTIYYAGTLTEWDANGLPYRAALEQQGVTIIPKQTAVIEADDVERFFGDEDNLTVTITDEATGYPITDYEFDYKIDRMEGEAPGTYTITPSGNDKQGNYEVKYVSGTLTINPAPVTLAADSGWAQYDSNEHTITGYTVLDADGQPLEDVTFEGVTASGSGTDKGSYEVTFSGVTLNETRDTTGNYVVTEMVNGTFTITTLLDKEFLGVTGNRAGYRLTINPDRLTLNEGNTLTLTDTLRQYDEINDPTITDQSIEYDSITITTDPEAAVRYDYSGYTGTYVIPDNTKVTIEYTARVKGDAGKECTFGNNAVLYAGQTELSRDAVVEIKTVFPSSSDVNDSTNFGMVKLFVYGRDEDGNANMEKGINGAQFILLDANQRPMTFRKGDHAGEGVTFTTEYDATIGRDGYADVKLESTDGDISIEKNTLYYLEMIKAPEGYKRDSTLYSFMITDDSSYNAGDGVWTYYNGDTMKVRLSPEEASLNVSMRFSGNYALPKEDQDDIQIVLQKWNAETEKWDEVERHAYSEFSYGSMTFQTGKASQPLETGATYRVIQEKQRPWSLPNTIHVNTTHYLIIGSGDSQNANTPIEFTVTEDQLGSSFNVVINNEYEEPKLVITKMNKRTGDKLPGAVFKAYKASADSVEAASFTTDANGEIVIMGGESFEAETLYYIVETQAPAGYLLAVNPEKVYFYFCNDPNLEEDIKAQVPTGETAVNLSESYDSRTIDNQEDLLTIPVIKTWLGNRWPDTVDSVVIGLHAAIGDTPVSIRVNGDGTFDVTQVEDASDATVKDASGNPMQVSLNSSTPYIKEAFKSLPPRDNNNHSITYSLVEEHVWQKAEEDEDKVDVLDKYVKEYGISNNGIYIVRNQDATTLTVHKTWVDVNGNPVTNETVLAAQSEVTFDVYRRIVPIEVEESNIDNETLTNALNGLKPVRSDLSFSEGSTTTTVSDLEKTDDYGNLYYYYVLESVPSFGDETYFVAEDNGSITIQNPIAPEITTLTVKKVVEDDPRLGSDYNPDFNFTLKLNKGTHVIRSYTVYTGEGVNPIVTDKNGEARFSLKNAGEITLTLPVGVTATVTEDVNREYETAAYGTAVSGDVTDLSEDARVFSYEVTKDNAVTINYTNTLHVVCKVVDAEGVAHPFESLSSALGYIRDETKTETVVDENNVATIQMLEDYAMPAKDVFDVQAGENIALATADPNAADSFPFQPGTGGGNTAVITRAEDGGSLLTNAGTLTLDNIILDGAKESCKAQAGEDPVNGGLIHNTGTLNVNAAVKLRNSEATGKGGAIYTTGTVNLYEGSQITGNKAENGAAVYLEAGILNIAGGDNDGNDVRIESNDGAQDGAVVVENTEASIDLSGKTIIYGNANARGEQANLCMLADSVSVIRVANPGLSADAKIGVRARDGYRNIGDQFAGTDLGFTSNLYTFINDIYGYKGRLKLGTSMSVAWEGHTLSVTKAVEDSGSNPSDIFTIMISSTAITKDSYTISGTMNYEVTRATSRTPGTIKLMGVRHQDRISISPLPWGSYSVSETADNYAVDVAAIDANGDAVGDNGSFVLAGDTDVTVTNTRKKADVTLIKTLEDPLIGAEETVEFGFSVKLTEADGTPITGYKLKEGTETNNDGEATFTMSPQNGETGVSLSLKAPVGALMQITETENPNYRITTSAVVVPSEGERTEIADGNAAENIVAFNVGEDVTEVTFANERKMVDIKLTKELVNKVSKPESASFKVSLTKRNGESAQFYPLAANTITNEKGEATVTFPFDGNIDPSANDSVETESLTMVIPEGTNLTIEDQLENDNFYDTEITVDGATVQSVSLPLVNSNHEIVFRNVRKTQTVVVSNTVQGYSGNAQAFAYAVSVRDSGSGVPAYSAYGFTNGELPQFTLLTTKNKVLTVPYGAVLTIEQKFVEGYENKYQINGGNLTSGRTASFTVAGDATVDFKNEQLVCLDLINERSSEITLTVSVSESAKMFRVDENNNDNQEIEPDQVGVKTWTVQVDANKTAQLGFYYTDNQSYNVKGKSDASSDDYFLTVNNASSYHQDANPAIQRVYNIRDINVGGLLRFGPTASKVTVSEQPLISFDANGGVWTTEMEGYHAVGTDRQVYQLAVNVGDTVAKPAPDPVYPTDENVTLQGWYYMEDGNEKEFHFADSETEPKADAVTSPITLHAKWNVPQRDGHVVTVKNGLAGALNVTAVTGDETPGTNYTIPKNGTQNLSVPKGKTLVLTVSPSALGVSAQFTNASSNAGIFTIDSVVCDGTVAFTGGICKITDNDHDILYDVNGNPTVYGTLSDAFLAYTNDFYTSATDHTENTKVTPIAVKLLVDEYAITAMHPFPNKDMILTTAGKNDADFPFVGVRDRATLYRGDNFTDDCLFKLEDNSARKVTITNIILDGRNTKVAKNIKGSLIYASQADSILNIQSGTTMRDVAYATYDGTAYGGAIYTNAGTLNVSAGLFSNLHAQAGGAIYADSSANLNLSGTNGRTIFEDCVADNNNGGAIYYCASNNVSINGGENNDVPGIIFNRCVALKSKGNGGGIFISASVKAEIAGCRFIECRAETTSYDNRTNGGGGIAAQNVKAEELYAPVDYPNVDNTEASTALKVSYCSFEACDTKACGGAIVTRTQNNMTTVIDNCVFRKCDGAGQGGAVAAYFPDCETAQTTTHLVINASHFTDCSTGTGNGSGGAIQTYTPYMDLKKTEFTNCWAGKEGGAINHFYGRVGDDNKNYPSRLTVVDKCSFTNCRSEDRYQPNHAAHYGGAIATRARNVIVDDSTFTNCVSTLREGGALFNNGKSGSGVGEESSVTLTNTVFTGCSAKTTGGAVHTSASKISVDGCTFDNCVTQGSGGAICQSNARGVNVDQLSMTLNEKNTAIGSNTFKNCSAISNGGAIWTRAKTVTMNGNIIQNCIANANGGGIYLEYKTAGTTATLKDCEITGCQATGNGGALYSNYNVNTTSVTFEDCKIKENQAVFGSAVYAVKNARMTFKQAKMTEESEGEDIGITGNIATNINGGAISVAENSAKLYFEGDIQVKDNTCSVDEGIPHNVALNHDSYAIINTNATGLSSKAYIGVYVTDTKNVYSKHGKEPQDFGTYANAAYLDNFHNDRDDTLAGYQLSTSDTKIYWGMYVCKITDENHTTLLRENGREAVYQRLSMALDEFTTVKDAEGNTGKAVYIEMLVQDYTLRQDTAITNFPVGTAENPVTVILTTANKGDENQKPWYRGDDDTVCTISRTDSKNATLFALGSANTTFILENITLDGRRDKTASQGTYRLIEVSAGNVVINGGTTMQYGYRNTSSNRLGGGAIYATDGASVTINGTYDAEQKVASVRFANCVVKGDTNGGAIYATNLIIKGEAANGVVDWDHPGTSFVDCSGIRGGAICVAGAATSITGVEFKNCRSDKEGGAFCQTLETNTAAALTNITKSRFENCYTDKNAQWSYGGAVSIKAGALTVDTCTFKECYALSSGGAISHGSSLTNRIKTRIVSSQFDNCKTNGNNNSYGYGGSVYTQAITVEVESCNFNNSSSYNHGGALYCDSNAGDSNANITDTSFANCSVTRSGGYGGTIYSKGKSLSIGGNRTGKSSIDACIVSANNKNGFSGAIYMETSGSTLNISDDTSITGCYANQGGAIYLKSGVTMNISGSPVFRDNGYATLDGSTVDTTDGSCIYLAEGSKLVLNAGSKPAFDNNIASNTWVENGAEKIHRRQDIYLAGYKDKTAESIVIAGNLNSETSTIWVWPQYAPHRKANTQFAKIAETVNDATLGIFRNALDNNDTGCSGGEYLAGVHLNGDTENAYWSQRYDIKFRKVDNKTVAVPDAGFTLYDQVRENIITTATSTSSSNNEEKGWVTFRAIPIGVYYMMETTTPESFLPDDSWYLVVVGSPSFNDDELWQNPAFVDIPNAQKIVKDQTTEIEQPIGIFKLDADGKAILYTKNGRVDPKANLAGQNAGVVNQRLDYSSFFKKVDINGSGLSGAEFTIFDQEKDENDNPKTVDGTPNGYPALTLWSRDGENYPDPVESADGTDTYKNAANQTLDKGIVYIKELPIGTYFLRETTYPTRNANGRIAFYVEDDRLFRLEIKGTEFTLAEFQPEDGNYTPLADGDNQIYNREAVCKLTDGNGSLLYRLGADGNPLPALFANLNDAFTDAASSKLYDAKGNEVHPSALQIQMLQDVTLTEPITYSGTRPLTLTTASRTATAGDQYVFYTNRTSEVSKAEIKRGYDETDADGALITVNSGANLTLQNISLNGQKKQGRAVHVVQGALTMQSDAMIRQFKQTLGGENGGRGGAVLLDDNTTLTMDGGVSRTAQFQSNEAADEGGAIAVGSGCVLSIENAQFTGNSVTSTSGSGGAIALKDSDATEENTALIENAVFRGNTASQGSGGAIMVGQNRALTIQGSSSLTNNSATTNGGAIYAAAGASVVISSGTISTNSAALGGAVYVDNGATMAMSGGTITGNSATNENGGAINVGGNDARLNFSDSPTIYDNPGKTGQQKNVVLSETSTDVIHVIGPMNSKAKIGVYTTTGDVRNGYGLPGKPFGQFDDPGYINNLDTFINDVEDLFGHPFGTTGDLANTLYWRDYIARVQDANGDWTYHEFLCTTDEQGLHKVGAFDQANELDGTVVVETLLPEHDRYILPGAVTFEKNRGVTLRTTQENDWNKTGFVSTITRGSDYDSASMFSVNAGSLTMDHITLDGDKDNHTAISAAGGIAGVSSGRLTIGEGATLQNSATSQNGGAVYVASGTLTIEEDATLQNCDSARCGGAVFTAKGVILTMTGGTITGNTAKAGGGIYLDGDSTTLENRNRDALESVVNISGTAGRKVVISDNTATTFGGGIFVGEGLVAAMENVELTGNRATGTTGLEDTHFTDYDTNGRDLAEGSGGAVFVDRKTTLRINDCVVGEDEKGNTASKIGGGIFLYSQTNWEPWASASVYITGETSIAYNQAANGGGIGFTANSVLDIGSDGGETTIAGNAAANGGGIYLRDSGARITMRGGSIRQNNAAGNGGGFYINSSIAANAVLEGVDVSNNTATYGGGGYANRLTLKNTQITGNWTTNADGEGPKIDGAGGLYLNRQLVIDDSTGTPTNISGNKTSVMRQVASDLHLPYNETTKVNNADSVVLKSAFNGKIYVTNPGRKGSDFGTAATDNDAAYKDYENAEDWNKANIVSQNDSMLYGRRGNEHGGTTLYWYQEYLCQITTGVENGDILYYLDDDGKYYQAAYMKLYDTKDLNETAISTLNQGIQLYERIGDSYTQYTGTDYYVEMLVDYGVNVPIVVNTSRKVTLTTALPKGDSGLNGKYKYGYRVSGKNVATISPGSNMGVLNRNGEAFMFRITNGSRFKVQNITMDGGVDWKTSGDSVLFSGNVPQCEADSFISKKDGFLFQMTNDSQLTLGDGATLQNAYTTHMWGGGAICFGQSANGAEVIMEKGSRIYRCFSGDTDNPRGGDYGGVGGAISFTKAAGTGNNTLTINGGTIEQCWAQRQGGAIYVPNHNYTLNLNGGTIKDCLAPLGGGIYLDNKASGGDYVNDQASAINIQGNPSFSGNYGTGYSYYIRPGYSKNKKNGTLEAYYQDGVPQDIFVKGFKANNPSRAMIITGDISAAPGSINVWIDPLDTDPTHYMDKDQFAVLADNYTPDEDALKVMLKAFRNARDDATTENQYEIVDDKPAYLTGNTGTEIGKDIQINEKTVVYWGPVGDSGFNVVFRKIDGDGEPLNGATFTLYKANDDGTDFGEKNGENPVPFQVSGENATAVSGGGTRSNDKLGTDAENAVVIKVNSGTEAEPVLVNPDPRVYGRGLAVFEKIPAGVYFIVENTDEDGTVTIGNEKYKPVEERYRLIVDKSGWYTVQVAPRNANGQPVWDELRTDASGNMTWPHAVNAPKVAFTETTANSGMYSDVGTGTNTIGIFTAMNVSSLSRKAILKKVDGTDFSPLGDTNTNTAAPTAKQARFTVYYADRQTVVRVRNGNDASGKDTYEVLENLLSGVSGAFWIGKLPYGTYYLHETHVPTTPKAYNKLSTNDNWFILTVNEDGVGTERESGSFLNTLSPLASKP